MLPCECLEKEAATADTEGAEPRIGVPLLRQKLRDPGMPGWEALGHIFSILTEEST